MGDDKAAAESLVSRFQPKKLLNQGRHCSASTATDQGGRRVVFLGDINGSQAIIMLERAAFQSEADALHAFSIAVTNVENLGANDIYHWYMASSGTASSAAHDLKINLICPCTEEHIKKYSQQGVRMVTETPQIYTDHIRPFMQKKREQGRLNWVFNIIEGRTEQEDVIIREHGRQGEDSNGFLLLPDLNWDRKTMDTLHLLALAERRDIWSLRDLRKRHVDWLKNMREQLLDATIKVYPKLEKDQLKMYIHYQPTYYHFHIHIVNVMLEAGATQATGKAFGLENLISQLETISGGPDASMADVSLSYFLGTASPLWTNIYEPLKKGESPKLLN